MQASEPLSRIGSLRHLVAGAILLVLAGCGGFRGATGPGAPGSSSGTPGPGSEPGPTASQSSSETARFHVDVNTGQVSITPLDGSDGRSAGHGRAVFAGSAVSFNSSLLLDEPGNVGVKVLNVSLVNHWGMPLGKNPDGSDAPVRVIFGPFTDVSAASDLRPKATVSTLAGTGAAGSADGPAATATFNAPFGACVGPDGSVYIADRGAHSIRKIAGGQVTTLAGTGAAGSADGQGTAAAFSNPYGIAWNAVDGALVVTENTGNRVRRVTLDGRVTRIAGTGVAGSANGNGAAATFNEPSGVAVDAAGGIYVAEVTGRRVRKITLSGDPSLSASYTVSTLAGSGASGSGDGVGAGASFMGPRGLAVGAGGEIYVVDLVANKIRRVSPTGEVVTIAGTGGAGGTDGPGSAATFNNPCGIASVNGALIVSDWAGNRVRQVSLPAGAAPGSAGSWRVQTLAGTGTAGSANGAGNVATFNNPGLLAGDGAGNVIVPDFGSHKVRQVSMAGGFFPVGAPTGSGGSTGGGGPATVQLSNAGGAIPSSGAGTNLPFISYAGPIEAGATSASKAWWFVIPAGVTAFEFTVTVEAATGGLLPPPSNSGSGAAGAVVRTLAGTGSPGYVDGVGPAARFGSIFCAAADAAGNLYVTDQDESAIRRITPAGQVTTIVGGPTKWDLTGDGPGSTARIMYVSGIGVTPDGTVIYFTDNYRVRRASLSPSSDPTDPGNWNVSTIAGENSTSPSPGKDDGSGDRATFSFVQGLVYDPASNSLYVSESTGNRVRRVYFKGGDPRVAANWQVVLLAGDNSVPDPGDAWADLTGANARFASPCGLALDRLGNVYVADADNNRIRKVTPDGKVSTVAGQTTAGYTDASGAAASFNAPTGVAVDSSGYVYVSEYNGRRVRCIDPTGAVTTVAGTGATGDADGPGSTATFSHPFGLTVDGSGNIYVCDQTAVRLIQRQVNLGTK